MMRSQTTQRQEQQLKVMEARLIKMGDTIKKLMEEVGMLQQENSILRRANEELVWGTERSHNEHTESRCIPKIAMAKEDKRRMHLELRELRDKYAEMAKWMGASSFVD